MLHFLRQKVLRQKQDKSMHLRFRHNGPFFLLAIDSIIRVHYRNKPGSGPFFLLAIDSIIRVHYRNKPGSGSKTTSAKPATALLGRIH
jgi:hypothetical protein